LQSELQLHVEAMRLTITQVYTSQMALLQEELEKQKAVELNEQHSELMAEYHQNLELLQNELEELEERAGKTIKSYSMCSYPLGGMTNII
jgi:hypothetical protein